MANTRPDRRTARSRQALTSAFIELMLERGYLRVTVADVADRANVGRSTLYAHFGGLEGMLKESLRHPSSHLVAVLRPQTTGAAVVPILEHFREQRRLNKVFFNEPVRGVWVRRLAEMIEPALATGAAVQTGGLPLSLVALQIAEGQIALVANWLSARTPAPTEAVAEALVRTTHANLAALTKP